MTIVLLRAQFINMFRCVSSSARFGVVLRVWIWLMLMLPLEMVLVQRLRLEPCYNGSYPDADYMKYDGLG